MFQTIAAKALLRNLSLSLQGRRPCGAVTQPCADTLRLCELSLRARAPKETRPGVCSTVFPDGPGPGQYVGGCQKRGPSCAAGPLPLLELGHPQVSPLAPPFEAGAHGLHEALSVSSSQAPPGSSATATQSPQPAAATRARLVTHTHTLPALTHRVPRGGAPPSTPPAASIRATRSTALCFQCLPPPHPQTLFSVHTLCDLGEGVYFFILK